MPRFITQDIEGTWMGFFLFLLLDVTAESNAVRISIAPALINIL